MAKIIDVYLTSIPYLKYEELLKMPVPIINSILEVRAENAQKDPGGDLGSMGPLMNAFMGRR